MFSCQLPQPTFIASVYLCSVRRVPQADGPDPGLGGRQCRGQLPRGRPPCRLQPDHQGRGHQVRPGAAQAQWRRRVRRRWVTFHRYHANKADDIFCSSRVTLSYTSLSRHDLVCLRFKFCLVHNARWKWKVTRYSINVWSAVGYSLTQKSFASS